MNENESLAIETIPDEPVTDENAPGETATDESVEDETVEDESAEGETVTDEPAENEPVPDEPIEDETVTDEPAEPTRYTDDSGIWEDYGNGIKALVEPSDAWLEENQGEGATLPPRKPSVWDELAAAYAEGVNSIDQ